MQDQPSFSPIKQSGLNKKIVYIIIAVIFVAILTVGVIIFIQKNKNSNAKSSDTAKDVKADADNLKAQAIQAQKTNDKAKALELLEQAKDKYEEAGDKNNTVDTEALIFLNSKN